MFLYSNGRLSLTSVATHGVAEMVDSVSVGTKRRTGVGGDRHKAGACQPNPKTSTAGNDDGRVYGIPDEVRDEFCQEDDPEWDDCFVGNDPHDEKRKCS